MKRKKFIEQVKREAKEKNIDLRFVSDAELNLMYIDNCAKCVVNDVSEIGQQIRLGMLRFGFNEIHQKSVLANPEMQNGRDSQKQILDCLSLVDGTIPMDIEIQNRGPVDDVIYRMMCCYLSDLRSLYGNTKFKPYLTPYLLLIYRGPSLFKKEGIEKPLVRVDEEEALLGRWPFPGRAKIAVIQPNLYNKLDIVVPDCAFDFIMLYLNGREDVLDHTYEFEDEIAWFREAVKLMGKWKMNPAVHYALKKNVYDEYFQKRAVEHASEEGHQEGREEERKANILNMLAAGMKPSRIATVLKLPLAYVENVKASA